MKSQNLLDTYPPPHPPPAHTRKIPHAIYPPLIRVSDRVRGEVMVRERGFKGIMFVGICHRGYLYAEATCPWEHR